MAKYTPYEISTGHPPDFEVEYEFIDPKLKSGERKVYPGIRWDFLYDRDIPQKDGLWMIWPEFIHENGQPNIKSDEAVKPRGIARMWILRPLMRKEVHQKRIAEGVCGYFVEGPNKMAKLKVTKIVGLFQNPVDEK